jgi:hypothetical protein
MPLAGSGSFTDGGGNIMKKIFGLQRHKLLMGDVVGALFAVRAAMLAD